MAMAEMAFDLQKYDIDVIPQHLENSAALTLALPAEAIKALSDQLGAIKEGEELKVSLPLTTAQGSLPIAESWVLFFKETKATERAMVAHPSQTEWIGSFLISSRRRNWLVEELATLSTQAEGEALSLSALGRFSYPSNLQLTLQKKI